MSDLTEYDIEKFYQNLVDREFSRKHQWRVTHIATGVAPEIVELDTVQTKLLIESGTIPQRDIYNVAVPFHGIDFNLPGNAKYGGSDAWNVTVRVDQQLNIRRMFEDWSTAIFDDRTAAGTIVRNNTAQLAMTLYDQQGNAHSDYTLFGIYPTSVGSMEYNVGDNGDIVTMDVTFAYHYWRRTGAGTSDTDRSRRPVSTALAGTQESITEIFG